jgi:redox-sensitive bicupin YhaK (pirin superfamily)
MEILTWVLEGALQHRDSMGNGSIIRPGEIQRMSAGTGITHSEFNASGEKGVHLYQIWILPERRGVTPSYEQRAFPEAERRGRLCLLASPDAAEESVRIHAPARLYVATLSGGDSVTHTLATGRHAWVQVSRGAIELAGSTLAAGDGAAVSEVERLELRGTEPSEVLVFDLA